MSIIRNPVAQFLAIGFLFFTGIVWATTILSARAANAEALQDARATTWILASSVAEPAIPAGFASAEPGAVDQFDREASKRLFVSEVQRIKIWAADGTIVYSDLPELIGSQYQLGEDELEILENGGVEAEVSDLTKPENRFERKNQALVEVYTQIRSPEGEPLLFEAYYSAADIDKRQRQVFMPFRRIITGALIAILGVATPMIWVLTRRLTRAGQERERLLRSAIEASDAERRRIARDLHDGVVQDIAGTAFSVSALARNPATSTDVRAGLTTASSSLRGSLRGLRSLLVEIHPTDLSARGLVAALEDLTAPAQVSGLDVTVAVTGVENIEDGAAALVWRVAQEAVRNTVRHARATRLSVVVHGDPLAITLEVIDDGRGFDPDGVTDPVHYGLRGLTSLVADAGARLAVVSSPGHGTTIRLEVPRP